MQPRSHAELVTLRKLAEELAAARKERLTTVHLLAAVAAAEAPASELLRERKLDRDAILKASRSFDDDDGALHRAFAAARDLGGRGPAKEPGALHLLLALLADRASAAHRALLQAGVEIARLRAAAIQLAIGAVAPRRVTPAAPASEPAKRAAEPAAERRPRAAVAPPGARLEAPTQPMRGATRSRLHRPAPMLASARPGVPVSLVPQARARAAKAEPATPSASVAVASPSPSTPPPAVDASARSRTLERDRFPLLAAFGKNLSAAAAEGRFDPVVGRDDEIDELLDVLAKRHTNSACLVGPPGVGKTSVVRGLAQRLVEEGDPRVVVELVASELVAGTGTRGALAERIASIIAEVGKSDRDVVLFFDEMHELFGGALDEATAELKRALGKGDIVVIGATTAEELKKVADADATLARRFTVLEIEEPNVADAFFVVKGAAVALGRHHRLAYADEAVASAVDWSIRYLPGRALPDKAIALLDLAGARLRRRGGASTVAPKDVAHVAAEVADVPVERLLETDHERMLNLEALLADRVVGHVPELARIARVLRRNAAGLRGRRPIGSFLLLGPTGVGKTETAKAIAEALFHSQDAMTRLDFSEYAEAHAVARLVGAPPGYVGHDAGGQLTEAVRRRPYQVVLLDEIEKAHRDVLEAFLQVLDEGRLTDGRGRRVDLTNVVIVMTSNLGAAEAGAARAERTVGFGRTQGVAPGRLAEVMVGAARHHLPPELYNRIDEVLCFGPLTRPEVAEIARRQLGELEERLAARGVGLDVDDGVVEALLASGGFDVELGARPLRRTLGRLVENPLAELILKGELGEGAVALVGVDGGEIIVDAVPAGAREHAAG